MRTEIHTFQVEIFDSLDELPMDEQFLIKAAEEAKKRAYAPYSNFKVGAAVLADGVMLFHGSNQETAVYNGTHAERAALDRTAQEGRKDKISKIAIMGDAETPITPCGPCRQDLKEVECLRGSPIVILMAGSRGAVWRVVGIEGLLPLAFGPENLKNS